jgi:hypothetical protein
VPGVPLRDRLRAALPAAMKARDRTAVSALRSTLSAIDNAEAVERPAGADRGLSIEQSAVGVGAMEVARRDLSDDDVERIVRAEIAERESAATGYAASGRVERAETLRAEAALLTALLAEGGVDTPTS